MNNEEQFQNRNDLGTSYSLSFDQQEDTYESSYYSSCEDDKRGDQVIYLNHEAENESVFEDKNICNSADNVLFFRFK